MGLDVTAYARVVLLPEHAFVEDCYEQKHLPVPEQDDFPEHCADLLQSRCYQAGPGLSFRAGSYSGYTSWREELCQAALGVSTSKVYANLDGYVGKPFFELINFSDCEGVIGPSVAAKLAKDFRDLRATCLPSRTSVGVIANTDLYTKWHYACELAAQNGLIRFH